MRYATAVVFEGAPAPGLRNFLQNEASDLQQHPWGKPRPAVTLRRDATSGQPVLTTDDQKLLLGFLGRGSVHALSALPSADLERLHGSSIVLQQNQAIVRMDWLGKSSIEERREYGPWYTRIVRLSTTDRLSGDRPSYAHGLVPADPKLWIAPLPISFERDQMWRELFFDSKFRDELNVTALPPWIPEQEGNNYFSAKLIECRRALGALIEAAYGAEQLPAMVKLWRLQDEPMLREMFLAGACLQLTSSGDRDGVGISFPAVAENKFEQSLTDYRQLVLGGELDKVPEALRAIRTDLTDCIGRPLEVHASGGARRTWDIGRDRSAGGTGFEQGSYQLLEKVAARTTKDLSIIEKLLVSPHYAPDHDLTERAFCEALFRCPTERHEPVWRQAVMELFGMLDVAGVLDDADPGSYATRIHRETLERPGGVLRRQGRKAIVSGKVTAKDLARIALLLPFDTRFERCEMTVGDAGSALSVNPLGRRAELRLGKSRTGASLLS